MTAKISQHLVCEDNSRGESVYFGRGAAGDLLVSLETDEGSIGRHLIEREDVPLLIKFLKETFKD